jgi:hypothetical protein
MSKLSKQQLQINDATADIHNEISDFKIKKKSISITILSIPTKLHMTYDTYSPQHGTAVSIKRTTNRE